MSNEDLLLREQYYIDLYETMMPNGYNMRPSDRTKGFNHSEYSKQLISSIKSGKTLSDETKAKISSFPARAMPAPDPIPGRAERARDSSTKGRIFTDAQSPRRLCHRGYWTRARSARDQRLKISEAGAARGARRTGITAGPGGPRREAGGGRAEPAPN